MSRFGRQQRRKARKLTVIATSDLHGALFPIGSSAKEGSVAMPPRIETYVNGLRRRLSARNILLIDNGDLIQGSPIVYWSNYIEPDRPNIGAKYYNRLHYDCATIGNHDIESGPEIRDKWIAESAPTIILAANMVDETTGRPLLPPYAIFRRADMKIAVIGLTTPAVQAWVPESMRRGLRFDDMEQTARKMVDEVIERENPDVIIGLFHTGADLARNGGNFVENAAIDIARNVDGFDAVIFGHDHKSSNLRITTRTGGSVLAINPGAGGRMVARIDIDIAPGRRGDRCVSGRLVDISSLPPSEGFIDYFREEALKVTEYVDQKVGVALQSFDPSQAIGGPSPFMGVIHKAQLRVTGADISMAAPVSITGCVMQGSLKIMDMFKFYRFDNRLVTLRLFGKEIVSYLERSYDGWIMTMKRPEDPMFKFAEPDSSHPSLRRNFLNPVYNFDSAAGIDYTVDLRAEFGQRVNVSALSDGRSFDPEQEYTVVMNGYRACGGGDLITLGAGLTYEELYQRIVSTTDADLRQCITEWIRSSEALSDPGIYNWKFIPEEFVEQALIRELLLQ